MVSGEAIPERPEGSSGARATSEPDVRFGDRCLAGWAAVITAVAIASAGTPAVAQETISAPADSSALVLLEADVLVNDDQARTITAEGDVQAHYNNRTLRADRVIYNLDDGTVRAIGNVELVAADGSVQYAKEVQLDEGLGLGVATELQSRFPGNGALVARSAVRREGGASDLDHVIYTSCPVCKDGSRPPTWTLRARRATQNTETQMISYRDAVLEVAGVPVFYSPYFAHPDPSAGPRSGLLAPDIGRNRRLGLYYEQPYHWAISPYQDLTISPQIHEQVNPLIGLDYRKRFWSGDLLVDTSFTHEQDFDGEGRGFGDDTFRGHIFATGRFRINDFWLWGFGAERASDDLYLRRYDISGAGETRGPFVGDLSRLISQAYLIGQDDRTYASVATIAIQGLLEQDSSAVLPAILPVAEVTRVLQDPILNGQLRLGASTAVLDRSEAKDSARVSGSVSWRRESVFGPGWVVSPFAEARADLYRIHDNVSEIDTSVERTVGMAGVELSWPFMRSAPGVNIVVEPIVVAAIGSENANKTAIPNEDSISFELDESNLFRPNGAPNFDLWETGQRLSAGVRATARFDNGNAISAVAGRRWRDEAEPQFGVETNLNGRASDWVGGVFVNLGPNLSANVRGRLRDGSTALQRLDAGVTAQHGRFSGSVRYFVVDGVLNNGDRLEEASADVSARLVNGWSAQFGFRRDLDSNTNLSQRLAMVYSDECSFLEIAYTRSETFDRRLGPNEGIRIRVGLSTLGVIGGGD